MEAKVELAANEIKRFKACFSPIWSAFRRFPPFGVET
jgi:hypothetical protein